MSALVAPVHRPIVVANTKDMPRHEWLALRRQGIGGSEAATVAGLDRWKSPYALWVEKLGLVGDDTAGEAAAWGNRLEDAVAQHFAAETGLRVRRHHRLLRHPEHQFMLGNLDREVIDPDRPEGDRVGLLECKTTGEYMAGEWADGEVPDRAALQTQHYLAVTGYRWAYVAVLIGGNKFRHVYVERDDELIADLVAIEADFWHHVTEQIPPPVDGHESTAQALAALYADADPESEVELPGFVTDLIVDYRRAGADEKAAKERKAQIGNQIKALVGDARFGLVDGVKAVTWSRFETTRLNSKALKQAHPDLWAEFAETSPSDRLTFAKEISNG